MKLTKRQAHRHAQACELINLDRALTEDEQRFVLDHWQESERSTHTLQGAFFTPAGLARDVALEVTGDRILDLGAGIGHLSWHCHDPLRRWNGQPVREMVCLETDPAYVQVGQRVLPDATWIQADIGDLPELELGRFDTVIANPPFGATGLTMGPRYSGRRSEYHVIDLARDHARRGVFLVPQNSAPFRYSGQAMFGNQHDDEYARFHRVTGIELESNCGIDTSYYDDQWHGVSPRVEVVLADFTEVSETAVDEARTRS